VAAEGRWIGGEQAPPDKRMRERFRRSVEDDSQLMLVADADGAGVVGGLFCEMRGGVGTIGMQLLPDWRGKGLGEELMKHAISWAGEQGAHKVALELWPHNQRALALYRRCGFEVEGRLRRHYRRRNGQLWDALVMGLVLDHSSAGSGLADAAL
jgi:RimJ/RimL family protein N-acetyltransferase